MGGRRRPEIVLADEDHRHLPQGREIDALVEGPPVGGAVAEDRHGDLVGAAHQDDAPPGRQPQPEVRTPWRPSSPRDASARSWNSPCLQSGGLAVRAPPEPRSEPPWQSMARTRWVESRYRRAGAARRRGRDGLLADREGDEAGLRPAAESSRSALLGSADGAACRVHWRSRSGAGRSSRGPDLAPARGKGNLATWAGAPETGRA